MAVCATRGAGEFDQSEGDVVFRGVFPVVFNAVGQSVDARGDDVACDADQPAVSVGFGAVGQLGRAAFEGASFRAGVGEAFGGCGVDRFCGEVGGE